MNKHFSYASRTPTTAILCIVSAGLCITLFVVWAFTNWPDVAGRGNPPRGLFFGGAIFCVGVLSLHSGAEWFRPVARECWLRDGTFGWRSPRRPRSGGEIQLLEVRVLRASRHEYFELLTARESHKVPLECVQDIEMIAALIAEAAPHIRLD